MDVTIRKSKDNEWGFVESFAMYQTIDTGNIKVVVSITPDGELSEPYVLRDEQFIPIKQIEEEMGIDKYIKAKKPFYSKVSDGFIAYIKAGVNYTEKEFIREKTDFIIYQLSGKELETPSKGVLHLKRVLVIPEELKELMYKVAEEQVSTCYGDRELFLKNRIK